MNKEKFVGKCSHWVDGVGWVTEIPTKMIEEKGYRKIGENEVVISKKEYEELKSEIATLVSNNADGGSSCHLCIKEHKDKAREETAGDIYRQLQGHGTTYVKKYIREHYDFEIGE